MPENSERPTRASDGLITRRTALGGLVTAVIAPALLANSSPAIASPPKPAADPVAQPAPFAQPVGQLAAAPIARMLHTATALPGGRILMVGGVGRNNRALASVQIYDANANAWYSAAPMSIARFHHAAVLLPDGRVLVTGGLFRNASPLSSGEIYDPGADMWTPAPAMVVPRYGHALATLADGSVIVSGGCKTKPLSSVETYIPTAAL